MNETILVTPELLAEAGWFAAFAALLAVLGFTVPATRRRGLVLFAALAVAMLAGLWALSTFGTTFGGGTPYDVAREAMLALLAVAVIRATVLFAARVLLGRFNVPHILVDAVFMLLMIAYAIYRLNAVGVNLAGVVTTSAIVTGALALSAGETLRNLWAGVSLQLENTLRIGDWVRIDDRIGQVVSIRWRSMAIATPANETVVVPNSTLMTDRIILLGRAGEARVPLRRIVPFQVEYDHAPSTVVKVITDALRRCEIPSIARTPAPYCVCKEFQDSGVLYWAIYYTSDIGQLITDSDVLVAIYAALQRENMPIPFPHQVVEVKRRSAKHAAGAEKVARTAVIDQLELFGALTAAEREALAESLQRLPYASNDLIFRKGDTGDSLYILAAGQVRVMDDDARGRRTLLAELSAPDYFGEMGLLTGQPRRATILANRDVLCYRLSQPAFDTILKARPQIADSLGHVVAQRQDETDAALKAASAEARARHARGGALEMIRRIRQFFKLPG